MLAHKPFLFIVVVPLTLVSVYYGLIASRQYESEAHIVVRSSEQRPTQTGGLGALLGMGGAVSPSISDAISVADYMSSHDAVDALRRNGLVEAYRRDGVDWGSRLGSDNPTPEKLLGYFRNHTDVEYDRETGITTVKVRTFDPNDSFRIANMLLKLGDSRVNSLNVQSFEDAVSSSRQQLQEAEGALQSAQANISRYRATTRDIDPEGTGRAQTAMVVSMTQELATARAQLNSMGSLISPSSPQYRAMQARVDALARQVAAQSGRLAGGGSSVAANVANYNEMQLRQEFAAKRYEAAATALQQARQQALRKQLYLVRVVNPNMPVKALYPQRLRIIFTAALGLLLTFGIVSLLIAGMKEHAA